MVFPRPDWQTDDYGNPQCTCQKWQGDSKDCPWHGVDYCWTEYELSKEERKDDQRNS